MAKYMRGYSELNRDETSLIDGELSCEVGHRGSRFYGYQ
jgi:hypothetical protein